MIYKKSIKIGSVVVLVLAISSAIYFRGDGPLANIIPSSFPQAGTSDVASTSRPSHSGKKVKLPFTKADLKTPSGRQKINIYMQTSQTQFDDQMKQDQLALEKFR